MLPLPVMSGTVMLEIHLAGSMIYVADIAPEGTEQRRRLIPSNDPPAFPRSLSVGRQDLAQATLVQLRHRPIADRRAAWPDQCERERLPLARDDWQA